MKTWKKRALAVLLTICMVVAMGAPVFAATKPSITNKTYKGFCLKQASKESYLNIKIKGMTAKYKVKNLKCSNKKIAEPSWYDVSKDEFADPSYVSKEINVLCLKPGTVKITGNIYKGSKKVNSFSFSVKVYKYQSPAKSFKLGKKNIASKFKSYPSASKDMTSAQKAKVSIKAKKGWKLKSIKLEILNYNTGKLSTKKIKNNKTIKFDPSKAPTLIATFYNKKQKRNQKLRLYMGEAY